jgi:cytochrome d ubiquinol oxidase subunit I
VLHGLNDFPDAHPPVAPVFWSFRIMVGTGVLMMGVGALGVWLLWRRRAWPSWYIRILSLMTFSGWVATLAGWYVTEIGRQPWLVQGVLRTRDAVAELPPASVGFTLALYLATYAVLLVAYLVTLRYLVKHAAEAALAPVATAQEKP